MEQSTNKCASPGSGPGSDGAPDLTARRARIRALNDALRCTGQGGRALVTEGVAGLPPATYAAVLSAVAACTTFEADNDPYGEHDFGAIEIAGEVYFWKIDTYDVDLIGHSPDASDPAVTRRVLTIMQAQEY